MVKNFQIHRHLKTCGKHRNQKSRFHFGKFLSDRTNVADALPDDMPEETKSQVFKNNKDLLSKVKIFLNCQLRTNGTTKLNIQFRKSLVTYACHSHVLKCVLPFDISIGQNEEFLHYILSNSFITTHRNNKITTIKMVKTICRQKICHNFMYVFIFLFVRKF